jgi:type VII secretion integral membrane protein EccD
VDANSGVELCRVTVIAPRTRMDLALPTDSPLADLLPTLLRYAGENPDDPTFLRGGWIMQRLGESALDPSQRLASLGVKDGDVLYLRHRETSIPEFAFDDVSDAIATATRTRRAAWDTGATRTASMAAASVFFLSGIFVALRSGEPNWVLPTAISLIAAVALLGGGAAMSRAYGDGRAGALLGAFAVAYASVGGLLLLGDDDPLSQFGPAQLLVGLGFAMVMSTICGYAIAASWDAFFAITVVAGLGAIASLAVLLSPDDGPVTGPQAAAIAITIALGVVPFLPTICARLAKLPMPVLPSNAEDLRQQTDVLPGPTVIQQAIIADKLIAAFIAGSATICVLGGIYVLRDPSWFGPALMGVTALALLLRARHFRGRTQRLWLMCGGVLCAVLVIGHLALAVNQSQVILLAVGLPCVVAAGILVAWGIWMPGRELSPFWGRYGDLLEVLVLLGVIPLTIGLLGVYDMILTALSG